MQCESHTQFLGTSPTTYNEGIVNKVPTGKPVQLIKPKPKNKEGYVIDNGELESIFGNRYTSNTPVAIYSLAGAYRKGKSFMLNFFLRYLWAENDHKSDGWLSSKEDQIIEGFAWRGGAERHTQGIWIWSEPFFVSTAQGKVAVFLMDTQGAFDPYSTVKDCSAIFALSTFMSSVQIYNVHSQIQEDTLQTFQLFTEYAKSAQHGSTGKSFQNLIFLIRDWSDPSYSYNFDGGKKVLKKLLQPPVTHHDTESVRVSLRESFENIECCLMPHPGFAVAERRQDTGSTLTLKDVRVDFLDTADVLVRKLFSPEEIVLKRINNKPVTGDDFIELTLRYFEQFSSGKMPEVITIFEATSKSSLSSICQDCKRVYKTLMDKNLEEAYKCRDKLQEFHQICNKEALTSFDKHPKMGGEKLIAEYKKFLVSKLEQDFDVYKAKYESYLDRKSLQIAEHVDRVKEGYARSLRELSGGKYVGKAALKKIEQKCREGALAMFKENLPIDPDQENHLRLTNLMNSELEKFTESNEQMFRELNTRVKMHFLTALTNYKVSVYQKCETNILNEEEFDGAHKSARGEAILAFDQLDVGENTEIKNKKRNKLLSKIEETKGALKAANDAKKTRSKNLEQARREYRSSMNKVCLEAMDEDELIKNHKKYEEKARVMISDESCIPEFLKIIKSELDDIQDNNRRLQKNAVSRFEERRHVAYDIYCIKMDEVEKQFIEANAMESLHRKEKSAASEHYSKGKPKCLLPQFESHRKELENQIDERYHFACKSNEENKKKLDDLGKSLVTEIEADYKLNMNKLTDGAHVDEKTLENRHKDSLKNARLLLSAKLDQSSEIKNKWIEECKTKLENYYEDIKKINKEAEDKHARERNEKNSTSWKMATSTTVGTVGGTAVSAFAAAKLGATIGSVGGVAGTTLGAVAGLGVGFAIAKWRNW